MNAFYDAQKRISDALREVRALQMDRHMIVMHPEKWKAILADFPLAYGNPSSATRLFGFDVYLDPAVDEDYLALRHEVRA